MKWKTVSNNNFLLLSFSQLSMTCILSWFMTTALNRARLVHELTCFQCNLHSKLFGNYLWYFQDDQNDKSQKPISLWHKYDIVENFKYVIKFNSHNHSFTFAFSSSLVTCFFRFSTKMHLNIFIIFAVCLHQGLSLPTKTGKNLDNWKVCVCIF